MTRHFGISNRADWDKPEGCHCNTIHERAHCYEKCEPVEKATSSTIKALFWTFVFIALAAYLLCPAARGEEPAPTLYCEIIMSLPRNCTSVRLLAKTWGKEKVEQRVRACGATDQDIAEGKSCFEKASP